MNQLVEKFMDEFKDQIKADDHICPETIIEWLMQQPTPASGDSPPRTLGVACGHCDGTGMITPSNTCAVCNGTGMVEFTEEGLEVKEAAPVPSRADVRRQEIIEQIVDMTLHSLEECKAGRFDAQQAIELSVFSALVVLDGESAVTGAEVRPILELGDGKFEVLEDVSGELHSEFIQRFKERLGAGGPGAAGPNQTGEAPSTKAQQRHLGQSYPDESLSCDRNPNCPLNDPENRPCQWLEQTPQSQTIEEHDKKVKEYMETCPHPLGKRGIYSVLHCTQCGKILASWGKIRPTLSEKSPPCPDCGNETDGLRGSDKCKDCGPLEWRMFRWKEPAPQQQPRCPTCGQKYGQTGEELDVDAMVLEQPAPRQPLLCKHVGDDDCPDCQGMDTNCDYYRPRQPRKHGPGCRGNLQGAASLAEGNADCAPSCGCWCHAPRQPRCDKCGAVTYEGMCYGCRRRVPAPRQPLICANVGHEHCEDCQGMDADCEDYLPQQPREGVR